MSFVLSNPDADRQSPLKNDPLELVGPLLRGAGWVPSRILAVSGGWGENSCSQDLQQLTISYIMRLLFAFAMAINCEMALCQAIANDLMDLPPPQSGPRCLRGGGVRPGHRRIGFWSVVSHFSQPRRLIIERGVNLLPYPRGAASSGQGFYELLFHTETMTPICHRQKLHLLMQVASGGVV